MIDLEIRGRPDVRGGLLQRQPMNGSRLDQTRYGWTPEQWPHASRIGRQTVSLPLSPKLSDLDVERVIAATLNLVKH